MKKKWAQIARTRWINTGPYVSSRTLQLDFLKSGELSTQTYLPDMWLEIVTYISKPDESLRSLLEKDDWLQELTAASRSNNHDRPSLEGMKKSVLEFHKSPDRFADRLEQYSAALRIRDMSEKMVNYATMGDTSRMKCWIALIDELLQVLELLDPAAIAASKVYSERDRALDCARQYLDDFRQTHEDFRTAGAEKSLRFLERSIIEDRSEEMTSKLRPTVSIYALLLFRF